MNTLESSFKDTFSNPSIIFSKDNLQDIEKINSENLINIGNRCLFRDQLVTPEFEFLSKIPFSIFTTIRDPFTEFGLPRNQKIRENYCKELVDGLNNRLLEHHPDIPSRSKTARFVRVDEFGDSEDRVHTHLLWHIHEEAQMLTNEVFGYLEQLEPRDFRGVRCFDNQMIKDRLGIVSYVCKVEKSTPHKHFGYSPFFYPLIRRKIEKGHWN